MLNDKDPSGMYSKTGKVLYEKMHILRKKDEILHPEIRKHNVVSTANEMDELVTIL
jgi:GMP synthase PP-ATPase subunit